MSYYSFYVCFAAAPLILGTATCLPTNRSLVHLDLNPSDI